MVEERLDCVNQTCVLYCEQNRVTNYLANLTSQASVDGSDFELSPPMVLNIIKNDILGDTIVQRLIEKEQ